MCFESAPSGEQVQKLETQEESLIYQGSKFNQCASTNVISLKLEGAPVIWIVFLFAIAKFLFAEYSNFKSVSRQFAQMLSVPMN